MFCFGGAVCYRICLISSEKRAMTGDEKKVDFLWCLSSRSQVLYFGPYRTSDFNYLFFVFTFSPFHLSIFFYIFILFIRQLNLVIEHFFIQIYYSFLFRRMFEFKGILWKPEWIQVCLQGDFRFYSEKKRSI